MSDIPKPPTGWGNWLDYVLRLAGHDSASARAELAILRADLQAARERCERLRRVAKAAQTMSDVDPWPEINMSNYDDSDVSHLNGAWCELFGVISGSLAALLPGDLTTEGGK